MHQFYSKGGSALLIC